MTDYVDPITPEEYFRGTLKVIAHWAEVDLSAEWEAGLRGVIRSITDAAREVLSAHPTSQHSSSPGAAFAKPTTVAANAYDGSDARPNSGLDSRDRGHNEVLIRQLREMATEFAIDNKTDCKQHVCWMAADALRRSSERTDDGWRDVADRMRGALRSAENAFNAISPMVTIAGLGDLTEKQMATFRTRSAVFNVARQTVKEAQTFRPIPAPVSGSTEGGNG